MVSPELRDFSLLPLTTASQLPFELNYLMRGTVGAACVYNEDSQFEII
jgi:hypothetical protein